MKLLDRLRNYWTLLPFFIIVLMFELIPLAGIVLRSFKQERAIGFTLAHYKDIFSMPIYQVAITNSLWVAVVSAAVGICVAFLTGMAIHYSSKRVQNVFMSLLNMTSNFAGLPLAFAYMIILGSTGVFVLVGKELGIPLLAGFNLYSPRGLAIIYIYFQIPLGTLLIIPAFQGIRKEWQESAALMKASGLKFWTRIGVPVLIPGIVGTFIMLFANALAAYATAYVLILNNVPLLPTKIAQMYVGDMRQRPEMGSALSVTMIAILLAAIGLSNIVKKHYDREGR